MKIVAGGAAAVLVKLVEWVKTRNKNVKGVAKIRERDGWF